MTREDAAIIVGNIPIDKGDDCYTIAEYQEAKAMAIKALEQESCDDTVSRRAVHRQINKWVASGESEKNLLSLHNRVDTLPLVTPQSKTGHWIPTVVRGQNSFCCSNCFSECCYEPTAFCPDCGWEMVESEE